MTWTTRQRSDFGSLSAVKAGSGPNLLMVHGVGLRAEAWNAQIDALSEQYRVIAVDMPGHGESLLPSGPLALSDYTDAIAAGLDGPAVLIGHSMGAMIVLDMAVRHPHLVRGVVAMNAIFQRSDSAIRAVQARAAELDGKTVADPMLTLSRWFGNVPSPEREACKMWLTTVNPAAYRTAYTVFANETGPTAKALSNLPCPALFMTGREEPNSTPAMSEAMAALAPKGRALIIENAAHMMPMTHADEVNTALLAFAEEADK